jgi:hypothetical protein
MSCYVIICLLVFTINHQLKESTGGLMKNHHILKSIIYIVGILTIALGINILLKSELGAGAWDTVAYNFSKLFENMSVGTASAIVNVTVLLFVFSFRRKLKYLTILFPIFVLALAIDLWNLLIFKDIVLSLFWVKLIFFMGGSVIITLGLALMVISTYPAMVYEELTLLLMQLLSVKKFFNMRIMIELFAIALAIVFGYLAGIEFGAVNLGSFVLAIVIGPIISLHLHWLSKVFKFLKP